MTGSELISHESRLQRRISFPDGGPSSQDPSNTSDGNVRSNGRNSQWESFRPMTEPLSGNPYFACILTRTNVDRQFQLVIPRSFYPELPAATVPAALSCGNKTWVVSYLGDREQRRFDGRWRDFAVDHRLKVGDACVFELMHGGESLNFKVQILDGSVPSSPAAAASDDGSNSDFPITID